MRNKKAFTMVELIVAIIVIGIIASIAVPKLYNDRFNAELASVKAQYNSIKAGIRVKVLNNTMTGKDRNDGIDDLGSTGPKLFTKVLRDGLKAGKTNKKGWVYTLDVDKKPKYTYYFNSSNRYEFKYDLNGRFWCTKSKGKALLDAVIQCDITEQ